MPFDSQRPPGPLVRPWIRAQVDPATIVGGGRDAQSSVIAPFNGESLVPASNTSPLNTELSAVTSDSGIGAILQVELTGGSELDDGLEVGLREGQLTAARGEVAVQRSPAG